MRPNLRVVATASDGELALEAVRRFRPDMLLLDVRMPYMDGVACLRKIRTEGLQVRVLMFSGLEDEPIIRAIIDAGADGVTLKSDPPQVTLTAIQQVAAGHMALPRSARQYLFAPPVEASPAANALTDREAGRDPGADCQRQQRSQMAEALRLSGKHG